MAEHGMIEPFEPGQIRARLGGDPIISYGTSSYGYDVRCANEFKIFTNINSAIVDPKRFDANSFVNLEADVCIIPPNSFALARTVEYFRIPRNVLTICVGKSTYARCFRGDTRVALVGGSSPTLEEMARRWERGERFRGYSVAEAGRIIETQLQAPRFIDRDGLLRIELDNGEQINCTSDHLFMGRDGTMVPAHTLRPGSALMSLNRVQWVNTGQQNECKVAAIRELPGDHDVYCLTVPETGNFALDAGVFVHNCGIIVNVTPLEPEWQGHVTLEFSNTTPLPARIYANEGVAQVLFLESDEVCETSYRDRGGKYQGQTGVTLPKT